MDKKLAQLMEETEERLAGLRRTAINRAQGKNVEMTKTEMHNSWIAETVELDGMTFVSVMVDYNTYTVHALLDGELWSADNKIGEYTRSGQGFFKVEGWGRTRNGHAVAVRMVVADWLEG